jgi:hypothetical protein
MKIHNPWRIPEKKMGVISVITTTTRFDPIYWEALGQMAAKESETYGRTISRPNLIMNLTTRDGSFLRSKRSELRKLYIQLKRENQSANNNSKEKTPPAI